MAKFTPKDPNVDDAAPPVERVVTPQPAVTVVDVNNNNNQASSVMAQQTVQMNQQTAQAQATASVGLAQTAVDKEVVEHQMEKEDEHWVKAYWRPAMGWLYMAMCAMDFIVFPIFSMIQPIVMRAFKYDMQYVAWQSLTLSNGGMIHIAFGAILGVAAYTRGQEKLAKIN